MESAKHLQHRSNGALKKKILVVDNHPMILRFMTGLLEREGHEVLTAPDGLSALDALKGFLPDIVFLDLVMPNINGEKLCRVIRTFPAMRDVYIVILSAMAAEGKLDLARMGADACIAKGPFDVMTPNILAALEKFNGDRSSTGPEEVFGIEHLQQRTIIKELVSSRGHFEVLLNAMSEGVLELTPDERIVYANTAASRITGLGEERLLAARFIDLFQGPPREWAQKVLRAAWEDAAIPETHSPLSLNNKEITLDVLPVRHEDHDSLIVILKDVTDRRRMEEQLLEAKKWEAIATLAGGVAHQFNNALSSILGNIELLKIHFSKDEECHKRLEPMEVVSHKMVELTNQLLAYARGGRYQTQTLSMASLVENTLALLLHELDPALEIETDLDPETREVKVDLPQIQMALSALLRNASEAIEGTGRIRISCTNASDADGAPGNHTVPGDRSYVRLTVEDTGKGMDEETKERIFEPFFSTKFHGRGLGLAAVFGIVRGHDGFITVESRPGRGTCMNLYLPAAQLSTPEETVRPMESRRDMTTILIIEDDETVLEVTSTMLDRLGYRVLKAGSGWEALQTARAFQGDIDLVLLDIVLPDMDGKEIYPQLLEIRPDLKVIVSSGHTIEGEAREILDAGAQDFIQKPFTLSVLSEKVKQVLGE
ncbi:MAG: response regulator [Deltaproteobacteria bacterium]|nr:response regulator [Deltaproteobacteria bacterium]